MRYAGRLRDAWEEAGRSGWPRLAALVYFGLGDVEERSRAYVLDYYRRKGEQTATMIADGVLSDPRTVAQTIDAFADEGFDELILDPTVADPEPVDLLAAAVR